MIGGGTGTPDRVDEITEGRLVVFSYELSDGTERVFWLDKSGIFLFGVLVGIVARAKLRRR